MAQRPRAFSYLRFSTPEQQLGDSERRQVETARSYAERHNLDFSNEFFKDLGVSAYRGKNLDAGLGAFLSAVRDGTIQASSYLLVENFDRISRRDVWEAYKTFQEVIDAGITLVTLSPEAVYSLELIKAEPFRLYTVLGQMQMAHEESAKKAERLGAAWRNKKRNAGNGDAITSRVPAWLEVRDGKIEIVEERAAIVRRIFDMAAKGHGKGYIARQLNVEEVPTFGTAKGWHPSYIMKILTNASVIGRYTPMRNTYQEGRRVRVEDGEPVEGYYPPVVEPSVFYSIKHGGPRPSGKNGGELRNVLSGLCYCGKCGASLHYVNKGPRPKGGQYLACDNRRRFKSCDAPAVPYSEAVREVLAQVQDFGDLEDDSEAQARDRELASLGGQIVEAEARVERILDLVEQGSARAGDRLAKLEAELEELKSRRAKLEELEIARHGSNPPPGVVYETFEDATPWVLAENPTGREDLIAFVRSELRRMVERIEMERGKPIKITRRKS